MAPFLPPAFQTLIGTVKGRMAVLAVPDLHVGFQTLIGTVKGRRILLLVGPPGSAFQTLIGTVKGGGPPARAGRSPGVSNPHRYGQRCPFPGSKECPCSVSNPHRYGQRWGILRVPQARLFWFQTLIGTVKGRELFSTLSRRFSVSNPHRYGQRLRRPGVGTAAGPEFQTLIGTVKGLPAQVADQLTGQGFKPS